MEELNRKIMQQEAKYDFLKEEVHCLNAEKIELQIRIDKAINYIEQLPFSDLVPLEVKIIYDILKGEENESK